MQKLDDGSDKKTKDDSSSSDNSSDNGSDHSTGSDSSSGSGRFTNTKLIQRGAIWKFVFHVLLLVKKTLLTMMRNYVPVIASILSPFLWGSCVAWVNSMQYVAEATINSHFDYHKLGPLTKCIGPNCITVGYAILGDRH